MAEETLCPQCGFSPIPRDAEQCPRCGEVFSFLPKHKRVERTENDPIHDAEPPESTTFGGGITGAVTAHPYPPAAAFATGTVIWFLRASGLLLDQAEPSWVYGLAGLDIVIPVLIILAVGPVTFLAQLVAVVQLVAAGWLARGDPANPVHILFLAHAVALLVMVVGEPDTFRRAVGLSATCALAVASVAVMGVLGMHSSPTDLGGHARGYRFTLPPGYVALTRDEVRPAMHVPPGDAAAFGNPSEHLFGLVVSSRDAEPLIGGCQALHEALGATNDPTAVTHAAPKGMGADALVYRLTTGGGGVGRLACGRGKDGRLVGFAVVLLAADPATADASVDRALDALGAELILL